MTKEQEQWKLFYDTTKALFVLSDEITKKPNWYLQELYYIKLVSFMAESIRYIEKVKALFETNLIMQEWLDCVRKGIDSILTNLSEEELVFIHYRRTRAAHMFQLGYEYDPKKPQKTVLRIRQRDGFIKQYTYSETSKCIKQIENNYINTTDFDVYIDRKLSPLLTIIRCDLNKIYKKMAILSQAEA